MVPPPLIIIWLCRHLVAKMKNVFEQVMMVDGPRRMRGDIIQKTFKVSTHITLCWETDGWMDGQTTSFCARKQCVPNIAPVHCRLLSFSSSS